MVPSFPYHTDPPPPRPHDTFIACWRRQMETFSMLLVICAGIYRSPVNSLHKGQWRAALMFSLICAWIKVCVNIREAGDLRRHRAHCDFIVMDCAGHRSITGSKWLRWRSSDVRKEHRSCSVAASEKAVDDLITKKINTRNPNPTQF